MAIDESHLPVLRKLFNGPRWLTAPPGYAMKEPTQLGYSFVWSGTTSEVLCEIEDGVAVGHSAWGDDGKDAHDKLVKELQRPEVKENLVWELSPRLGFLLDSALNTTLRE